MGRVGALLSSRERFARVFVSAFDVLLVGAYVALMLLYDLKLGGIIVAVQSVVVLITALGRTRARTASIARQIASSNAQSALVQAFSEPEVAKVFGAESLLLARYAAARSQEARPDDPVQRSSHVVSTSPTSTEQPYGQVDALVLNRVYVENRSSGRHFAADFRLGTAVFKLDAV